MKRINYQYISSLLFFENFVFYIFPLYKLSRSFFYFISSLFHNLFVPVRHLTIFNQQQAVYAKQNPFIICLFDSCTYFSLSTAPFMKNNFYKITIRTRTNLSCSMSNFWTHLPVNMLWINRETYSLFYSLLIRILFSVTVTKTSESVSW